MSQKVTISTGSPAPSVVEAAIVELLAESQGRDPEDLRDALVKAGAEMPIDSLEGVEIILDLEEKFGVRFPDDKDTCDALRSVKTLARRVQQLAADAQGGARNDRT
jgi:acyl carrier protein